MGQNPPRLAKKLLGLFASSTEKQTISGDLEEYYHEIRREHGAGRASRAYWSQALSASLYLAFNSFIWSITMLRSYLILALRKLKKDKVYSIINISGLAIGLACSFLIAMWVIDETSYDRYQPDADRIYRVKILRGEEERVQVATPVLLAEALETDLADVTDAALVYSINRKLSVQCGEKFFLEERSIISDNNFFDIFDVEFLKGSSASALNRPQTVVLSESIARKYFGNKDPIGRSIGISTIGKDYEVTGVFRDCPGKSHLQYNMIFNYDWGSSGWGSNSVMTYVKLVEGSSPVALNPLMAAFVEKNYGDHIMKSYGVDISRIMESPEKRFRLDFQPLTSIHLDSRVNDDLPGSGDITYVYIFSLVAFLILLVACVNFINLSTARAGKRAKEVGVRKVVGAGRNMLVRQFLLESILSSGLSFVLSACLIYFVLPGFNGLVGKAMSSSEVFSPLNLAALFIVSIVSGLIAGTYPAFYLSSFKPAEAIKSGMARGTFRSRTRDGLVIFQYTVATVILLSAFVIYSQSKYLTSARLGFDKDRVLVVHRARLLGDRLDAFIQELGRIPGVMAVSNSNTLPGRHFDDNRYTLEGAASDDENYIYTVDSDSRFAEVFGVNMSRGRFFSDDIESDKSSAVVINETAAEMLGLEDPVGKRFLKDFYGPYQGEFVTIIGVLEDFNFYSLHHKIGPLMVRYLGARPGYFVSLRLGETDPAAVVNSVRKAWNNFGDEGIFEYSFLNDDFDALYKNEMNTGRIMLTFFVLSIVIACLGLYGLVSFSAEQRTKEIGIRKVLGASTGDILVLLSRRITWLVLVANIIACPLAWMIMDRWLENFAYRASLSLWMPLLSVSVGLALALVTVSHRAIAAAIANPIKNIRYE
ncbi:MAG: ABC transporter permease [Bacteroidales bacterium]|nr:ABC transporter permease [Candidatus Latescibacterota bacterium]